MGWVCQTSGAGILSTLANAAGHLPKWAECPHAEHRDCKANLWTFSPVRKCSPAFADWENVQTYATKDMNKTKFCTGMLFVKKHRSN